MKEKEETEDETDQINPSQENQFPSSEVAERSKTQLEIIGNLIVEYLSILEHYIFALFSVSLACIVVHYTNFFEHLFNNPKVNSFYFSFAIISFSAVMIMFSYVSFYLPFKKTEEEIDKFFNQLAPICTIIAIVGIISLIICVWNIYYYFSILIILIIAWGFIMSANFAPNGKLGNVFFFLMGFAALSSGKYINHKGHTYY